MADTSDRIEQIFKIVEQGDYFVINRPRQYGKTTSLYLLNKKLEQTSEYFPVKISFEKISTESYKNDTTFIHALMMQLWQVFQLSGNQELMQLVDSASGFTTMEELSAWFSQLVIKTDKRVVLMIDEVDKSLNNVLFLVFLGMLRNKYLKARGGRDIAFHSVILAGVHDIKTLKIKPWDDEETTYDSPWNIAANFNVDLSLSQEAIAAMLAEYSKESEVTLDIPYFSERLRWLTSGYPFLVSYLCKIIDEFILPGRAEARWLPNDLTEALKIISFTDNTNFESMVKNLEDIPELYDLVFQIIMNEKEFSYNAGNPVIHLGVTYGILREEKSKTRIHNRFYEQLIYEYMASKMETSGQMKSSAVSMISSSYIDEDGSLNIGKVIRKFQEFMKEQHSQKDSAFIERNGRLLFLAFIKPIIDGQGFDFKEVQISEEKRLEVVITFGAEKYIVELKVWRGESYHREGIKQLCAYLESQNLETGYLLIYDLRKETGDAGKYEKIQVKNKTIITAWV
jgi:hypothetical protein